MGPSHHSKLNDLIIKTLTIRHHLRISRPNRFIFVSFSHCVVCPPIYGSCVPLCYLQTFLIKIQITNNVLSILFNINMWMFHFWCQWVTSIHICRIIFILWCIKMCYLWRPHFQNKIYYWDLLDWCHLWSRNYLPFWSTWVHPRVLVGFVLLDL